MNVTLNLDDERLVQEKLRNGEFATAEAVVSEALQALREREQLSERERDRIRAILDERWEQANDPSTEWIDGDAAFNELRSLSKERRAKSA